MSTVVLIILTSVSVDAFYVGQINSFSGYYDNQTASVIVSESNYTVYTLAGSTVFGLAGQNSFIDGTTSVATTTFGKAIFRYGSGYIVPLYSGCIRYVNASTVSTVLGNCYLPGQKDGSGNAAQLRKPTAIIKETTSSYLMSDYDTNLVSRLTIEWNGTGLNLTIKSLFTVKKPTGMAFFDRYIYFTYDTNKVGIYDRGKVIPLFNTSEDTTSLKVYGDNVFFTTRTKVYLMNGYTRETTQIATPVGETPTYINDIVVIPNGTIYLFQAYIAVPIIAMNSAYTYVDKQYKPVFSWSSTVGISLSKTVTSDTSVSRSNSIATKASHTLHISDSKSGTQRLRTKSKSVVDSKSVTDSNSMTDSNLVTDSKSSIDSRSRTLKLHAKSKSMVDTETRTLIDTRSMVDTKSPIDTKSMVDSRSRTLKLRAKSRSVIDTESKSHIDSVSKSNVPVVIQIKSQAIKTQQNVVAGLAIISATAGSSILVTSIVLGGTCGQERELSFVENPIQVLPSPISQMIIMIVITAILMGITHLLLDKEVIGDKTRVQRVILKSKVSGFVYSLWNFFLPAMVLGMFHYESWLIRTICCLLVVIPTIMVIWSCVANSTPTKVGTSGMGTIDIYMLDTTEWVTSTVMYEIMMGYRNKAGLIVDLVYNITISFCTIIENCNSLAIVCVVLNFLFAIGCVWKQLMQPRTSLIGLVISTVTQNATIIIVLAGGDVEMAFGILFFGIALGLILQFTTVVYQYLAERTRDELSTEMSYKGNMVDTEYLIVPIYSKPKVVSNLDDML